MHFRQIPRSEPGSRVDFFGWMTRIDVLSSLRLHKLAATLIALSTVAVGVVLSAMYRPVYTATSVVDVSPSFHSATSIDLYQQKPYPLYLDEQIRSITSDRVLSKAVQKLKPAVWLPPGESLDSSVARLRSSLLVRRDPQSYHLVEISLSGKHPEHLAETVNTVTTTYLEEVGNEQSAAREEHLRSLRQARDRMRRNLASLQQEQARLAQAATHTMLSERSLALRRPALRFERAALRGKYLALGKAIRTVEMEGPPSGSVHLASAARTPTSAVPSYMRFILPLLLPFTLLTMVGGVVLIDLVDDRVHSRKDVEKVLGFATMGALFNDREVTTETFDRSSLRLAAGIDQLARTSGVRTIVLTPATVGGASIAKNLGNMLARLGRNTLAIDSTGATPPVVYVPLDLNHAAHREIGGGAAARANGHTGSTPVIAQPFAPSVTPLTNFIQDAFEGHAKNYDLVLVDAAPILSTPETEHMARFADVTVLVAEAGHTTKAQLVDASRLLQQLQIRGMATVIHQITFRRADRAMREDERDQRRRRGRG